MTISLTDERGVLQTGADAQVTVTVTGSCVVQWSGSADPKSEEYFFDTTRTTYDGQALAVIRYRRDGCRADTCSGARMGRRDGVD